jgi:hypothetical protein
MAARRHTAPLAGVLVAALACGSRSGLDLPVLTGDAEAPDAAIDAGAADASSTPDATGAVDATLDAAPPADASLADASLADAPDGAPPAVCVVDTNSPGAAYWALQAGGPAPMSDGQGDYLPAAMALDSQGNVIIAGSFYGTMQLGSITLTGAPFTLPGYPDPPYSTLTSYDVFVAKLDSTGKVLFAKAYGDGANQFGQGVGVDGSGNIYVTGQFAGTIQFDSEPALSTGVPVNSARDSDPADVFVAKLDPNGNAIFSRAFGGADDTIVNYRFVHGAQANGIAVDPRGDFALTGFFSGPINFTGAGNGAAGTLTSLGNFNPYEGGFFQPGGDAFLARFTSDGSYVFADSFGTPGSTQDPLSVAIDAAGEMFVWGSFQGSIDLTGEAGTGPGTLTSPMVCGAGAAQPLTAFLAKYDASGEYAWGRTFPANGHSPADQLAVDPTGAAVVTGSFSGTSDLADSGYVADAALPGPDGSFDCVTALNERPYTSFLARVDGDGGRLWSEVLGAPQHGFSNVMPLAVDQEGGIYVGEAQMGPPLQGAPQWFVTVSRLDPGGGTVWSRVYGTSGGSFVTSMRVDSCAAKLFVGGVLGSYPDGSTMSVPGVDGVSLEVASQGSSYAAPIDMWITRLVP